MGSSGDNSYEVIEVRGAIGEDIDVGAIGLGSCQSP